MNHRVTAILIILAAIALLIMGCSKEKEESPGDQTAVCMQCHGDNGTLQEDVQAKKTEWAQSVHASDNTLNRNGVPCAGCHTDEGFITRLTSGFGAVVTVDNPSPIHCFTCHAPHTNFNFDLRTATPVSLLMGGTFSLGHGNLCANCHQARVPDPPINPSGATAIASTHWGPHDAPEANCLLGLDAYIFNADSTVTLDTVSADGYDGDGNSDHTTLATNGCPMCHMATPFSDLAGGHEMSVTYLSNGATKDLVTGCNVTGCHGSSPLANFDYLGRQDSITALLSSLQAIMVTQGIMSSNGSPVVGSRTPYQAAAIYNWTLVNADRSLGVHNYKYIRDLLQASINALSPSKRA
jgi:hypothetical protein